MNRSMIPYFLTLILVVSGAVVQSATPGDTRCHSDLVRWSASFDKAHPGYLIVTLNTKKLQRHCSLTNITLVVEFFDNAKDSIALETLKVTRESESLVSGNLYKRRCPFATTQAVFLAEQHIYFKVTSELKFAKKSKITV
jgi:hypothetical protein